MPEIPTGESIGNKDQPIWVELSYQRADINLVHAYVDWLEAYEKGDEAVLVIGQTLQNRANEWGSNIMHIARASNPAAVALYKRSEGYEYEGTKGTNEIFTKMFQPVLDV